MRKWAWYVVLNMSRKGLTRSHVEQPPHHRAVLVDEWTDRPGVRVCEFGMTDRSDPNISTILCPADPGTRELRTGIEKKNSQSAWTQRHIFKMHQNWAWSKKRCQVEHRKYFSAQYFYNASLRGIKGVHFMHWNRKLSFSNNPNWLVFMRGRYVLHIELRTLHINTGLGPKIRVFEGG